MNKALLVFALALLVLTTSVGAQAQSDDPAITATRVFGKITEINAPAGQLVVKTDAGSVITVGLNSKTTYERMPPGETDRSKAIKIELTDIAVGDGVYARGYVTRSEERRGGKEVRSRWMAYD